MDELTHLLLRAGQGEEDALSQFISTAQPDVWRFCAAMLTKGERDDATQETFVRAWRSAPGFRGDASARTWLLAIARRVCFDAIERRTRTDTPQPSVIDRGAADHSETIALTALVRRLESERRTAFVLTQLLGLSYQEVAMVAACPVGTVRSRVARARRDLQLLLKTAESESGPPSQDIVSPPVAGP